ncbi:hypothetical protein CLF_105791 [Clonorchis sinensis]|uniref:Uncharacterized protein n=1 Tax=Clonorchis sinensis TaxID=79923 RepID=G7YE73_CLOSI|nr:hypothetical protein CLF_105791 [Clonorchis sinensis]
MAVRHRKGATAERRRLLYRPPTSLVVLFRYPELKTGSCNRRLGRYSWRRPSPPKKADAEKSQQNFGKNVAQSHHGEYHHKFHNLPEDMVNWGHLRESRKYNVIRQCRTQPKTIESSSRRVLAAFQPTQMDIVVIQRRFAGDVPNGIVSTCVFEEKREGNRANPYDLKRLRSHTINNCLLINPNGTRCTPKPPWGSQIGAATAKKPHMQLIGPAIRQILIDQISDPISNQNSVSALGQWPEGVIFPEFLQKKMQSEAHRITDSLAAYPDTSSGYQWALYYFIRCRRNPVTRTLVEQSERRRGYLANKRYCLTSVVGVSDYRSKSVQTSYCRTQTYYTPVVDNDEAGCTLILRCRHWQIVRFIWRSDVKAEKFTIKEDREDIVRIWEVGTFHSLEHKKEKALAKTSSTSEQEEKSGVAYIIRKAEKKLGAGSLIYQPNIHYGRELNQSKPDLAFTSAVQLVAFKFWSQSAAIGDDKRPLQRTKATIDDAECPIACEMIHSTDDSINFPEEKQANQVEEYRIRYESSVLSLCQAVHKYEHVRHARKVRRKSV